MTDSVPPPPDDELGDIPSDEELAATSPRCTDSANADAIVAEHGRGYLFVLEWGAWIAWDGKRWNRTGARQRVIHAAMHTARMAHWRLRTRLADLEEKQRQLALTNQKDEATEAALAYERKCLKWHELSQNHSRLEAAAKILETCLRATLAELDQSPWLLNVANGTIDLRTAELRPHDRDDKITQLANVEWDDSATCPTWDAFVAGAMGGDLKLVLYLQRLIGYALTGLTTEHILAFFYGGGRNGKSTFVQTVRSMLGEYSCAAPRELLFEKKNASDHPTEMARLYGKRFAACAEIGEHTVLDEAKVKDLTGGDAIPCRRMREDFWDLIPTHTLIMSGNHKPTVRGDDLGIWRRIRLVPWTVSVDEADVDQELPAKLLAELPGILRWCVNGCLEWRRIGLSEPSDVIEATKEYRAESDALGQFLAQHTRFEQGARISRQALRERYETWCEELGYVPLGARKIAQRLKERGVREINVREGVRFKNGWGGVRLLSDYEMCATIDPVPAPVVVGSVPINAPQSASQKSLAGEST
jgi:putative DNA primase/helicase